VDRKIYDGEWKRQFEGSESVSQHGPAADARFSSAHNLRTNISGGTGKGAGSKVTKSEIKELKAMQEQIEMNLSNMDHDPREDADKTEKKTRIGYKDKMKREQFAVMDDLGRSLQLHDRIIQLAQSYFATIRDAEERLMQKNAVTAACMIMAMRKLANDDRIGMKRLIPEGGFGIVGGASKKVATGFKCKFCGREFAVKKDRRLHLKFGCPEKKKAQKLQVEEQKTTEQAKS